MADIPRLAPPPSSQRMAPAGSVSPDDVTMQLQMMGLSDTDAQKPVPKELVEWGPEPDDLDAELAMVEQELAQLNTLEVEYETVADSHVVQAEGDYEVWKVQQEKALLEFDPFPDYTKLPPMSPPAAAAQSPTAPAEQRFSSYGALASDTAALKFNQPSQSATGGATGQAGSGRSAWLEFESPFAADPAPAQPAAAPTSTDGKSGGQQMRAVFQFIPRHADELELNVGDPVVVESKSPDLWCTGQNLRSGKRGIFPANCVFGKPEGPGGPGAPAGGQGQAGQVATRKKRAGKFRLRFVGAVQVTKHGGVDLICAAIAKVHNWRKKSSIGPLKPVILEISAQGIKMTDISDRDARYQEEKRQSIRMSKNFDQVDPQTQKQFFFPLVNVTFCSCHPKNIRLWAFIVKRKDRQFTCQVFVASQSTQPLTVAMGRAFKQLHASYMSHAYPTQDYYQE